MECERNMCQALTHTHTLTNPSLHVRFVVVANFLDPDVVLGVDKRLCCCVCFSESHHAGDVLEVGRILHLNLPSIGNTIREGSFVAIECTQGHIKAAGEQI